MYYRFFILLFLSFSNLHSQDWNLSKDEKDKWDLDKTVNIQKRNILLVSEASIYLTSILALNKLWYANYPKSDFHFINDNSEWLQMDKVGHIATSYYAGVLGIKSYRWTGMNDNSAIWYGGLTGTFFLTIIEVLDGYSAEWGASSGDLVSNSFGSLLAISQELYWEEQRIQIKYSYSPSRWAHKNPEQLGRNNIERVLKDYNGQTYWLSFNVQSLFNIRDIDVPDWFNVSIGYSGDNMITPSRSLETSDFRERQYFLSFDIDMTKIRTRNKILNNILHLFGFLKFPAPAIELRNGDIYLHSIYY